MAIFHDTGEASHIFDGHDEIMSSETFRYYAEKHGVDRALGYLEAMRDFNHHFKVILGGGYIRDGQRTSDAKIRKQIIELFHDNDDFLHQFVPRFEKSNEPLP